MTYEIVAKQTLTAEELAQINELVRLCNEHDGIDLKINPDTLQNRFGKHTEDFLCYADGKLVGFLGLYVFHRKEAEASGMVHPDYRRKGIFSGLQRAAEEECKQREIPSLLFIVQHNSQSGAAYMQQIGATYEHSEHWMDLGEGGRQTCNDTLRIRPETADDYETLIQLNVHGFQMEEQQVREMAEMMASDLNSRTYLVIVEEEAVGKISVSRKDAKAFIYGFCVHPDHQGKGYGRQALAQTIRLIEEEGYKHVSLEVACENSKALGLYESCGFAVKSANDYYRLNL